MLHLILGTMKAGKSTKFYLYADNVELRYANCDICSCKKAKYHIGSGLIGDNYLVICEKCNKIKE